jgi:hypothetical protein
MVIFGGLTLFAAYPFFQMIRNGHDNAELLLLFFACMSICVFAAAVGIGRVATIFNRKPYLTLKPTSLIYSEDGKEFIELPWLHMKVTHASTILFQATVHITVIPEDTAKLPVNTALLLNIPLNGFERPGEEIARLLSERVNAAVMHV